MSIELTTAAPGVALLTLNRPNVLNAITTEMFEQFDGYLKNLDADKETKVIIVTGAGRAFSSGHDVNEFPALTRLSTAEKFDLISYQNEVLARPMLIGTPVIAAVNGHARGGALAMAAACDLRFCSTSATFGVTFIEMGSSSGDAGLSWVLPRIMGRSRSMDFMLSGRAFDAEEALATGLVDRLFDDDELIEQTVSYAQLLARHDKFALRNTKRAVGRSASLPLQEAIDWETTTNLMSFSMEKASLRSHVERFGVDPDGDR